MDTKTTLEKINAILDLFRTVLWSFLPLLGLIEIYLVQVCHNCSIYDQLSN